MYRHGICGRKSRPLDRSLQGRLAVETERDIEALEPLSRRALDEVVEGGRHHGLVVLRRHVDQAEVGVARELCAWALRDHAGEGLACIELPVSVLQLGQRSLEVEVACG